MSRTDKAKNIWKVAEVIAENPHATIRDIAKEADIWIWTVHRAKTELEQTGTKDETIAYIVWSSKRNLKNISKANEAMTKKLLKEYLDSDWEEYTVKEDKDVKELIHLLNKISAISNDDLKRITVLWWDLTNKDWWLIVNTISFSDLP